MRRVRRHSVAVALKNDLAPVQDDKTIGVGFVDECIEAVLLAAMREGKRREIHLRGRQLPDVARGVGDIR